MRTPGPDIREVILRDRDGLFHLFLGLEKGLVNHCGSSVPVRARASGKPARGRSGLVPAVPVPAYQRADPLTAHRTHHVALAHQVEDDDRQVVVHAQANGRRVHELQLTAQDLAVVEPVEQVRVRSLARVGVVDALHLGALQNGFGTDFQRPLRRAGIGREEWRAKPGPENDDPALLQVPDRPPRYVRLRHLAHGDRRLDPRLVAELLQHILERETVDHGAEHAHVVGSRPVDTACGQRSAAEHVPAADHDRDLDPEPRRVPDLAREMRYGIRIDTEASAAGEGLAGQLEHDPVPARALGTLIVARAVPGGSFGAVPGGSFSAARRHTVPRPGAIWQCGLPSPQWPPGIVSSGLPDLEPGEATYGRPGLGK